jgi:hypothetical protein
MTARLHSSFRDHNRRSWILLSPLLHGANANTQNHVSEIFTGEINPQIQVEMTEVHLKNDVTRWDAFTDI